jgi:glycosyltransferase involved in cell wall biosynthesis
VGRIQEVGLVKLQDEHRKLAMKNLTIVIPYFNGAETIERLLESLPPEIPVVIVDDMSDEGIMVDEDENIKVIRLKKKRYFAGAVNVGIQECQTDVLILNQDTWFRDNSWTDVINRHRRQYAFIGERIRGNHPAFGDLGYIHGTFMFLRRDAIEAVGFLNERDYPLWGNTAEYQWRVARKGFKVLPLQTIPGFNHERPKDARYGSSIKQLLEREPDKKELLTRTPPLLSIIVPCYNYGHFLADCINSLIGGPTNLGVMPGQTLQSFEVIIVDDASTDSSPEMIKAVTDISKGIRSYRLDKNVGTARALNYGIERAVGKYITFLSADDMRESDSLENLVRVCEQNPHSFVYDDVWLFHTHRRIKKWEMPEYDFETLLYKNHVHAGIVFPREAWVDVGGYPAIMNDGREDWAFNIALGIKGWCGVHVKQFGYLYRREGQNRTERNTTPEHRERFLGKIMGLFPDIYGGYRPVACCGKGSNNKSNNGVVSSLSLGGSARMASSIGAQGMVKIEYLGNQVNFTISGDVTNATYTFGRDRPKGWVDKRDVGTRDGKQGFLSKKDRLTNRWLYRVAGDQPTPAPEPEPVKVVAQPASDRGLHVTEQEINSPRGPVGATIARGTLTAEPVVAEKTVDYPNPADHSVEEIKRFDLTKEQWEALYKDELANRSRKGLTAWLEERLANWES